LGVAAEEIGDEALVRHVDRDRPPASDLDLGGDAPGNNRQLQWPLPLLERGRIGPGMPHALDRVRELPLN